MAFQLTERPLDWIQDAPIRLVQNIDLCASATEAFAVLVDHKGWTTWFHGMRKVRIDGESIGVGALRTVWVGAASVQEHFVRWEENAHLTFNVTKSSLPSMAAMTEDWLLTPKGDGHCTLTITIGVAPSMLFRPLGAVVRAAVKKSTSGAAGISQLFPCP